MNDGGSRGERARTSMPRRAASPWVLAVGVVLLGHAAAVLGDLASAPAWVPVVECAFACALGLSHLHRLTESPPEATTQPVVADAPGPSAYAAPVLPARVATPLDDVSEPVAGT